MRPAQHPKRTTPVASQGPKYPYTIHRMYLCGHPDEYIQIDKAPDTNPPRLLHTIVPPPLVVRGKTVKPYKQTRERCTKCAKAHRASKRHPRSLAAHRIQPQSSDSTERNGFTHVLRRESFFGRGEEPTRWPEEREGDPGYRDYSCLKELHHQVESGKNVRPHSAVAFEERAGRRTVEGPKWEGRGKLVYVAQTAVDPALAPGLGHDEFNVELPQSQTQEARPSARASPAGNWQARGEDETRLRANTQPEQPQGALPSPLLPPSRTLGNPQVQIQRGQARSRANTHESGLSRPRVPPPPPRQSPPSPRRAPEKASPRSNTGTANLDEDEVARNRALALQQLQGRASTPGERHSDIAPLSSQQRPPSETDTSHDNVPSYINHQRPFEPNRLSGGTTLSFGDRPRQYRYNRNSPPGRVEEPGLSVNSILETLYPPCRFDQPEEEREWEREQGGGGRGSYGSYRSFESQRYPGPRARSRGSGGSMSSFDSQRHPGP
ncbi:hypothetical protein BU23DRAFT_331125 [Bimuria novae-zelandiae CBS 107.79]|uniref:Uncharacterized protein n=1 Tax=Bimuria novae-zelandiae CBS 107.79 TaxID=1447943 RepID=A0A6A5UTP6_9PLEO|nr:hypothetical protein BU23DRAFT_331125 [Bimuria novae-zelandiae CBS 107.79]